MTDLNNQSANGKGVGRAAPALPRPAKNVWNESESEYTGRSLQTV